MRPSGDSPEVAATARSLGVRAHVDIPVDDSGLVRPAAGGLSVSPDDALNLPRHRLPPEYGGTGKDPVWSIGEEELGARLTYRPDPDDATHGFVEPAEVMAFLAFESALAATASRWELVGTSIIDVHD
jgi:hypothetical protein